MLDLSGDLRRPGCVAATAAVVATAVLADAGRVTTRLPIERELMDLEAYEQLNGFLPPDSASAICGCDRGFAKGSFNVWDDGLGDYSAGRWVWLLEDIQPLPQPIPAKGHQGFWNWEPPT